MTGFPIFDGHNDTLLDLYTPERGHGRDFFTRSEFGHIDLPRAREANFGGGFFAIFVPSGKHMPSRLNDLTITENGYWVKMADPVAQPEAEAETTGMIDLLFDLEVRSQGELRVVRRIEELENCLSTGVMAAILHFEGAEAIKPDLSNLEAFYARGLRSLGLVWSRPNVFGQGVPFMYPHTPDTGEGLTEAGTELVRACNQLGIMLDLSHLNERGFWDVSRISESPLVVTHADAHAICPSTRNLTDQQLDAIRVSDGMVGLNFSVCDLRPDAHLDAETPLSVMVDQIDYLVERLGIEHVGFGSDFDGTLISREIGDVAGLPRLITALEERGYHPEALRKITHANWVRVLGQTWK